MTKMTTYFLFAVALLLAGVAYIQGGWAKLGMGLSSGGSTLLLTLPLIIAAFIVAGLVQVLISRPFIEQWLGNKSGFRGVLLGTLAGALIPGGPYVYYPLAASFLTAGASLGTVISFVAAKNLISVTRIPMEVALIGPYATAVRLAVTWFIPFLMGLGANRFFGYLNIVPVKEGNC
ncbi:MAG: permease [Firmicutes bacterium]|nr:permease [Bacillota bacterium]